LSLVPFLLLYSASPSITTLALQFLLFSTHDLPSFSLFVLVQLVLPFSAPFPS
jgi:hypothetical protein